MLLYSKQGSENIRPNIIYLTDTDIKHEGKL